MPLYKKWETNSNDILLSLFKVSKNRKHNPNTHKKMCIHIIASVIDIAISFIVGVITLNIIKPSFNCINRDVMVNLSVIAVVGSMGVHGLDMLIQCCVKRNGDNTEDNQFNPKSVWAGIFCTFLHLVKLIVICAVILPNLKYPQETCDNTIIFFSILFVLVTFFVIVLRAIAHIKHVRQK